MQLLHKSLQQQTRNWPLFMATSDGCCEKLRHPYSSAVIDVKCCECLVDENKFHPNTRLIWLLLHHLLVSLSQCPGQVSVLKC